MADTASARPLVFVSLGTDHHPFPRILVMVSAWSAAHPQVEVIAQSGHTEPSGDPSLGVMPFMGPDELAAMFARADAVVCHGGPSMVMEARKAGHSPIVVARDPALGEHVDAHQMRFVVALAETGSIVAVQSAGELARAIDRTLAAGKHDAEVTDTGPTPAIARIGELLDGLIDGHRSRTTSEPPS